MMMIGVKPLAAEDALSKGVNFLSESVVFSIAAGLIILEYNRSEAKNAEKARKAAEKEAKEAQYLENRFTALKDQLDDIEASLPVESQDIIQMRRNARLKAIESALAAANQTATTNSNNNNTSKSDKDSDKDKETPEQSAVMTTATGIMQWIRSFA